MEKSRRKLKDELAEINSYLEKAGVSPITVEEVKEILKEPLYKQLELLGLPIPPIHIADLENGEMDEYIEDSIYLRILPKRLISCIGKSHEAYNQFKKSGDLKDLDRAINILKITNELVKHSYKDDSEAYKIQQISSDLLAALEQEKLKYQSKR